MEKVPILLLSLLTAYHNSPTYLKDCICSTITMLLRHKKSTMEKERDENWQRNQIQKRLSGKS
jgi:hypothetical protein